MNKKLSTGGQILVEILLALALAAIFMAMAVGVFVGFRATSLQSSQMLQAQTLFLEQYEALRSIREDNWDNLPIGGPYHVAISGSKWTLVAGQEQIGDFIRSFNVSQVRRDQNGEIVLLGGGLDPNTKKITINVSKITPTPTPTPSSTPVPNQNLISQEFYLTRFIGNTFWLQTTQADFDAVGVVKNNVVTTNVAGGEVVLARTVGGIQTLGNQFLATLNLFQSTSDSTWVSMRFTAQSAKTVNQLRFYQGDITGSGKRDDAVELHSDNSGRPGAVLASGIYSPPPTGSLQWVSVNLNPTVPLTKGTVYHLVVRRIPDPNSKATRSIGVRYSIPANKLIPYDGASDQASSVLVTYNSGNTWNEPADPNKFQPIYLLGFTDNTFEGNPLHKAYDDTVNVTRIFGTNFIGEEFTITGSSQTVTGVSFYVRRSSSTQPEDDLYVTLYDVTGRNLVETGTLATKTAITTNYDWKKYTLISPRTLVAGRTYRFYLSSPRTSNTHSYVLSAQETENGPEYIGRTFDGSNSFYIGSIDSGSSWTFNTSRDVPFRYTVQTVAGYQPTGTFESQTFDSGGSSGFNYLTWTATKPVNTNLNFQIATNTDNVSWNYVGPDGTATTYFDLPQAVPLANAEGQYFRFKAYFTSSDGSATPVLADVTLNYSQ